MPELTLDQLWMGLASVGGAFVIAIIWLVVHAQKARRMYTLLEQSKRETHEIMQLPLYNPHPQIQITESGRIIFANQAALNEFSGIQSLGAGHAVLKDFAQYSHREISYQNKIYDQTIISTRINEENMFVIYFYDITERKWYETKIEESYAKAEALRREAEHAKEARGEFLANMSHELRTPMNGIIGLSDILLDLESAQEKYELVEAVNSSAKNLLILLNDILDFSKIEAGELKMESIPFDIRHMLKQIDSLLKPLASQKGLLLETIIDKNVPDYFLGDPSRLQQILNNLISNALKFTAKGSVTLRLSAQKKNAQTHRLSFDITDTGIGIAPEKQALIFQKFQQADSSTARKYGGTGLGLSITKDLVHLMNGVIKLESAEGKGTTFTVEIDLPESAQAPAYSGEEDTASAQEHLAVDTAILIVDDHPINLLFLKQALLQMGFSDITEARSGVQALEAFKKSRPGLIIMDCQMPEMDGYEAARHIHDLSGDAPAPVIIAATADAMKGAEEKCREAGMHAYITKPIDKEKLRMMLREWIPATAPSIKPYAHTRAEPDTMTEKHLESAAAQISQTAQTARSATAEDLIDWTHLRGFTNGDADLEKQIIHMFTTNLKSDVSALHKSLQNGNYEEWDSWVHKLYGSCSNVGARAMAAICNEGQLTPNKDTRKIHQIHARILQEYQRLRTLAA